MKATVISCLLYFACLCAPGALLCAYSDRRLEESLPVSLFGVSTLLYLCGLAGALRFGAALVMLLCAGCYIGALILLLKKRVRFYTYLGRIATPATVLFTLFFAASIYCNSGRVPYHGDEFSHWAYAVKAMTRLDDFAANPASMALYGSYPPGTQLLQYLLQTFYGFFAGKGAYCDWLLFIPYQTMAFLLFCPFLKGYDWRRFPLALALGAAIFALPLLLFPLFYESTFIDPILALVAAYCLATIYRAPARDGVMWTGALLAFAMLTLCKDAAMLFAAICLMALFYRLWHTAPDEGLSKRARIGLAGFGVLAVAGAKLSWQAVLRANGTPLRFSKPIEWEAVLGLCNGSDAGYRQETLQVLYERFFGAHCPFGTNNFVLRGRVLPLPQVVVPYWAVFLVLLLALFYVAYRKGGHGETGAPQGQTRARRIGIVAITAIGVALYLIGLAGLYLFQFYEFEALELWCFERYIGVALLLLTALLLMLLCSTTPKRGRWVLTLAACCCIVLLAPLQNVKTLLTRTSARGSAEMMQPKLALAARVETLVGPEGKAFVITQGSDGEGLALRYYLYPTPFYGASIGPKWYVDDPWAKDLTAEQLQALLLEGNYTHVVLDRVDAHLLRVCGALVDKPDTMEDGAIYAVEQNTGRLRYLPA